MLVLQQADDGARVRRGVEKLGLRLALAIGDAHVEGKEVPATVHLPFRTEPLTFASDCLKGFVSCCAVAGIVWLTGEYDADFAIAIQGRLSFAIAK